MSANRRLRVAWTARASVQLTGIHNQLGSQYGSGYPLDVATWAVDYLAPDWNAEAAEQAKSYLEYSSFSRDGLYEQLTSQYGSQFTPEQANAGLAAVGY
ncbi:Host cell surface-exposed lipoprotein [Mycetocola miduiensis]|uniref:Host cell surface-exposed lipoprotein n=1 Tax=Mycetocola miduiensis TaxID=995034 RepID=A0A1I5CS01_9MICO|nr:Host cell surface-exposed lipoprotein [Mycetocola miduiensis]